MSIPTQSPLPPGLSAQPTAQTPGTAPSTTPSAALPTRPQTATGQTSNPDDDSDDNSFFGGLKNWLSGKSIVDIIEDVIGIVLIFIGLALIAGKDGANMLGNFFKSMFGGLLGGGQGQGQSPPSTLRADNLRPVDPSRAPNDHENKTIAAGLTLASLVNFGRTPNETAQQKSIRESDEIKVADDLYKAGKFIQFYNDTTKQYEAPADARPETLRQAADNDTSRRMMIKLGDKARYFVQIDQVKREDSPTGFAAAAWRETDEKGNLLDKDGRLLTADGKFDIWMGNPGFTGKLNLDPANVISGGRITDGTPQGISMERISDPGQNVNPQNPEAVAFAARVLKPLDPKNIHALVAVSQSMGVSAGHAETLCFLGKNVAVTELPLDPVADTHQVNAIRAALNNRNSDLYKALQDAGVSDAKIAELYQRVDFKSEEDPLRVVIKGSNGYSETAEATVPVGYGLRQGAIFYTQGTNLRVGNGVVGNRQEVLDLTAENLPDPAFDGHKLLNIFLGLEHNDAIYEVRQTLDNSGVTMAANGGAVNGAAPQPGLPSPVEVAARSGPT